MVFWHADASGKGILSSNHIIVSSNRNMKLKKRVVASVTFARELKEQRCSVSIMKRCEVTFGEQLLCFVPIICLFRNNECFLKKVKMRKIFNHFQACNAQISIFIVIKKFKFEAVN